MSFTPGPWLYRPEEYDDWGTVRTAPDAEGRMWHICQARDPKVRDEPSLSAHRLAGTDPWEANARLIAAAPDLLADGQFLADRIAELEGSLSEGDAARDYCGHVLPALARFRAAIAKATEA